MPLSRHSMESMPSHRTIRVIPILPTTLPSYPQSYQCNHHPKGVTLPYILPYIIKLNMNRYKCIGLIIEGMRYTRVVFVRVDNGFRLRILVIRGHFVLVMLIMIMVLVVKRMCC